jgi:predicted Ser/Thr protein kinase
MNCPRCDSPAETQALQQFGGVCPKCLLEFAAEKDAPAFPNLEIQSTLGQGGMGVVYKAIQQPLGRTVAVKVLSPQFAADPAFVERFTREAKALAQLSHPNIVSIHDFGVHDGVPYLIMEFVDGTPLRKMMAAGKLTPERALEVVPQICDALHYAHSRGVVHRDVKPENVLVDREGRVKIADFGLAKLAEAEQTRITRTNAVMGTPHYMAPEQIENPSSVDHRADIYSLGVIFYEMLTGELPLGRFKAPSERASVDRRFDPVVLRSLEKEPDDRYQSAGEVKEHVSRIGSIPGDGPPAIRWPRRGRGAALVAAAIGGLIVALSYGSQMTSSTQIRTETISLGAFDPWIRHVTVTEPGRSSFARWNVDILSGSFLGVVVFVAALLGLVREARRRRTWEAAAGGPRRSPLAHAAGILLVMGVGCILVAMFLVPVHLLQVAEILFIVGCALLIATLVVSVKGLLHDLFRRGLGGRVFAAFGGAIAVLVLLAVLLLAGGSRSESPPALMPSVTRPPSPVAVPAIVRLEDAWPGRGDLPSGLEYERETEGDEARKQAEQLLFPKEVAGDCASMRYALVRQGRVQMLGFEFKSEYARRRWENDPRYQEYVDAWGKIPQGLSMILLNSGDSPEARAAADLIRTSIYSRMEKGYPRNR